VAQRVTNGDSALDMSVNKSMGIGPSYGYRVTGTVDQVSKVSAIGQLQTTFGRYSAGYYLTQTRGQAPQQYVGAEAAGSIVVVPKVGLFAALPVTDGFGVIRVPNVPNVRGYVNNQEIGRTNRRGNMVVPNVLSYYGNQLRIDPDDVPFEYAVEKTTLVIAPPQRGVALAEFKVTRPHFYRGKFVVEEANGKQVVPRYGQVRVGDGDDQVLSPLSDAGEFDLENVPPGDHTFYVDYEGGTCVTQLTMPDKTDTLIELGELVCKMHP
jgi:outer membrane usher protein